ncbi:LysR substrate binding domain-containing protein [Chelatococcus asaccharovorans]|uniref:LysR substrate binding domain-containing protein n=1 Tax=Chelatococcus asaccharovorans TaxID=28210 RepID=A0A2V3UEY9_9HYPH|nr:LysR substrate binding domain-containing protein [Chelatococcus asaccharovorans]
MAGASILRDPLDYPIAAPTAFGGSRAIFDAAREDVGLTCTPMIETNSMHVLAGFLAAGAGVSITALGRAQMCVGSGILTVIPVVGAAPARGRVALPMCRGARLAPIDQGA